MSLFDKIKDVSKKASDAVSDEYRKHQEKLALQKAEEAKLAEEDETRKQKILKGEILPIKVNTNLSSGEIAYVELGAQRMASVKHVVQEIVGKSKKKHIVRRAVVGGVLLGPLGAVAGAATAGSKNQSTTTQKTISSTQLIDSGSMILTNRRFIFIGNDNVISLPYNEIIAAGFNGNRVSLKYTGMLDGEYYEVNGEASKDAQLYFNGITNHLKETA